MMKMKEETTPEKKGSPNSEIRIRGVLPEVQSELDQVRKQLKKPFDSQAVVHLVMNFRQDQILIKQLQARNTQLHSLLAKAQAREERVKNVLASTVRLTKNLSLSADKEAKRLLAEMKKKGGKK